MKIKKGFYWHVHHERLIEWCYDYQNRVYYIKKDKPKNEIETRLRLFKKVKGKIPKEFAEAWEKYDEAWKKYDEAWEKYDQAGEKFAEVREKLVEARNKRDGAWKKYDEAREKYNPQLEELHKQECGCSEWNGEEIVFTGEDK